MPLDLGGAGVGEAGRLLAQRADDRLDLVERARRHVHRAAAAARQQPGRQGSPATAAEEQALVEAHHRAVHVAGLGEHVHLAAPDQGDRAGLGLDPAVVEQVHARPRAQEDQLVEVVAVRLPHGALPGGTGEHVHLDPACARSQPHQLERAGDAHRAAAIRGAAKRVPSTKRESGPYWPSAG